MSNLLLITRSLLVLVCLIGIKGSKTMLLGDFPGGSVARGLHPQCRGPGFNHWSGN